ncbi:MAG: pyrroline-5-carboxylate reductase [Pseudomonadota bacterium]|nr:pyrroline-5-carboxylate reductase [Pseudomonadota bacterium]
MTSLMLVGYGKMGGALLDGWLDQGKDPHSIVVVEPNQKNLDGLKEKGVNIYRSRSTLPSNYHPQTILLAVKPQIMKEILPEYIDFSDGSLFITIAAGKTLNFYEKILGSNAAIIRVMPNTPAAIRRGIAGAVPNSNVSDLQIQNCTGLIEAVSELHWLKTESQIDVITAISGSGPAYVFLFAECLAEAGKALGLSAELSERLGRVTVAGSGELLHRSLDSMLELRKNVTSPGGTTEAAIKSLSENNKLQELIAAAVEEAVKRSRELAL